MASLLALTLLVATMIGGAAGDGDGQTGGDPRAPHPITPLSYSLLSPALDDIRPDPSPLSPPPDIDEVLTGRSHEQQATGWKPGVMVVPSP